MSFLYARVARAPLRIHLSTTRLSRPAVSFSTSSHRALNEGDGAPTNTIALADTPADGEGREDVAEHYEKHKQEQLEEQKQGKGKWRKELGSNSEQAVKADRGELDASDENIAKLQKETAESAQAEKKGGSN